MALGTPSNVTSVAGTNVALATSAFTITAGAAIYVAVYSTLATAPSSLTISSSPSLTWTSITDQLYDSTVAGGALNLRMQVWRATSTGVSTTVTITPGATAPARFGIQVISISGAATYVSNIGSATSTTGDPVPSLANAPLATSTVLGFFGAAGAGVTGGSPAGYSEINQFYTLLSTTSRTFQSVYDAGSAAQSATWSTALTYSLAVLVEVKEEQYASGSSSVTFSPTGTAAGRGALAGASALSFTPAGGLTGRGALSGASALSFSLAGIPSGRGALSGASALSFTGTAILGGSGALGGATALTFSPAGILGGLIAASGSSSISFISSGTMAGGASISGSITVTFTLTGNMTQVLPIPFIKRRSDGADETRTTRSHQSAGIRTYASGGGRSSRSGSGRSYSSARSR